MPDKPDADHSCIETYLPEEFPHVCGQLGIDQEVLELKALEDLEPNDYAKTINRWENLGIVLNGFTSWHKLPTSIQEAIKCELIAYFKMNPRPSTQEVRYTIWKIAEKHLRQQDFIIEVEKIQSGSNENLYKVIDLRVINIMQATDQRVRELLNFPPDAPPTTPGIPSAIKSTPPSPKSIPRRSGIRLKQIQPGTTEERTISKPTLPRQQKG